MTPRIFKDGTDQYVLTRLGSINNTTGAQDILLGVSEGYSLTNLIDSVVIAWSEYKKADDSLDHVVTWNSGAGMWKILIPSASITGLGTAWLNISGQDDSGISIIPTAIEVEVVTKMAYKKVVPAGFYEFDPANNKITLSGEYASLGAENIISIFSTRTGIWLYNSELRKYGVEPGKPWSKYYPLQSVAAGVITYTAPDTGATSDDVLQIVVNSE